MIKFCIILDYSNLNLSKIFLRCWLIITISNLANQTINELKKLEYILFRVRNNLITISLLKGGKELNVRI